MSQSRKKTASKLFSAQLPRLVRIRKSVQGSIHFLHLRGLISGTLNFLKRGQIIVVAKTLVIIINAEAKLDHAVDTTSKLRGLVEVEARREERGVEEQPNKILHGL